MGSGPSHDTSVLEQDALIQLLLFTRGYKWVPVRVEVDVFEKNLWSTTQAQDVYSPGSWERLQECYWHIDQGSNVKHTDTELKMC